MINTETFELGLRTSGIWEVHMERAGQAFVRGSVQREKGLGGCGVQSCGQGLHVLCLQGAPWGLAWVRRAVGGRASWRAWTQNAADMRNSCWGLPFPKTGPVYQKKSQSWILCAISCFYCVWFCGKTTVYCQLLISLQLCPEHAWCTCTQVGIPHATCSTPGWRPAFAGQRTLQTPFLLPPPRVCPLTTDSFGTCAWALSAKMSASFGPTALFYVLKMIFVADIPYIPTIVNVQCDEFLTLRTVL